MGVAEAGSESSAGLPPHKPSSEVWTAALGCPAVAALQGSGSARGAISGSALECGPGKVILQWVGANYRPACSSFQVLQPPGRREASEPAEGLKGPLGAAEAPAPRAGPAFHIRRAAWAGARGRAAGPGLLTSHRQGHLFLGTGAAEGAGVGKQSLHSSAPRRRGDWLATPERFFKKMYSALLTEQFCALSGYF